MPVTQRFPNGSRLSVIIPGSRIHTGLLIAVCVVFLAWLLLYRSRWGYAIRMTGQNPVFAKYSGINVGFVIILSQVLGGLIGGVGGAIEVLGMYPRFSWVALTGFGWDGVTIAIFAKNNPAYVPLAALFLAYLRRGAYLMSVKTDVQSDLVGVIEAIMVLLLLAEQFLSTYKQKMVYQETMQRARAVEQTMQLESTEGKER